MRRTTLAIAGAFAIASAAIAAPPSALAADLAPVTITLAADRTTVDADHRDATITGVVTKGADKTPVAGVTVDLSATGRPDIQDPVTGADGTFSATYASTGVDGEVTARTAATDELEAGQAGPLVIKVAKSATRMTLLTDKPKTDRGVPFTLSGIVEYASAGAPGGWKPLPGADVTVHVTTTECGPYNAWPKTTTGADGRYSVQTSAICTSSVDAQATVNEPWFEATSANLENGVAVRPASWISGYQATMDPYGLVKISGAVTTGTVYRYLYGKQAVLERSWDGRSWWKYKTLWLYDGGRFASQFTVNESSYWRVRFAGTDDVMPSTSKAVGTLRWTTKMSKISVSPTRVRRNGYTTAKGTLVRYSPTYRKFVGYSGQNVRIIFRYKGQKTWYHLAWAKTDRYGRFSKKVRAYGDGYYAAIFHGSKWHWATGTPNTRYVDTYAVPGTGRQVGIQSVLRPFTLPAAAPVSSASGVPGTTRVG